MPILCLTLLFQRLEAIDEWEVSKKYIAKGQNPDEEFADDIECIRILFSCFLVIVKGLKSNPPPLMGLVVAPASKKASNFTSACLTV